MDVSDGSRWRVPRFLWESQWKEFLNFLLLKLPASRMSYLKLNDTMLPLQVQDPKNQIHRLGWSGKRIRYMSKISSIIDTIRDNPWSDRFPRSRIWLRTKHRTKTPSRAKTVINPAEKYPVKQDNHTRDCIIPTGWCGWHSSSARRRKRDWPFKVVAHFLRGSIIPQGTELAHANGGKYQTGNVEAETRVKPSKSHNPPIRVRDSSMNKGS